MKTKINNSESTELGTAIHPCEKDILIKLTSQNIPYPNSLVLLKNKSVIGKIDEVLGPVDDVYASVRLDEGVKCRSLVGQTVYAYKDKFMCRSRFMERSEVEKKKEKDDRSGKQERGRSGRQERGRSGRQDSREGNGRQDDRSGRQERGRSGNFKRKNNTEGKRNYKK